MEHTAFPVLFRVTWLNDGAMEESGWIGGQQMARDGNASGRFTEKRHLFAEINFNFWKSNHTMYSLYLVTIYTQNT